MRVQKTSAELLLTSAVMLFVGLFGGCGNSFDDHHLELDETEGEWLDSEYLRGPTRAKAESRVMSQIIELRADCRLIILHHPTPGQRDMAEKIAREEDDTFSLAYPFRCQSLNSEGPSPVEEVDSAFNSFGASSSHSKLSDRLAESMQLECRCGAGESNTSKNFSVLVKGSGDHYWEPDFEDVRSIVEDEVNRWLSAYNRVNGEHSTCWLE